MKNKLLTRLKLRYMMCISNKKECIYMRKIPTHYIEKILSNQELKKNDIRVLLYLCEVLSPKKVREFKNKSLIKSLEIDKSTLSTSLKTLRENRFIIKHNGEGIFGHGYTLNFSDDDEIEFIDNYINCDVYDDEEE